jgi:catechol 2,3-dioxygenase-like lactoylglutathione lyase family enzyme
VPLHSATLRGTLIAALGVLGCAPTPHTPAVRMTTVALRVHHAERMERFYARAFGAVFESVQTGPITSRFARIDGITLKLVPIRQDADFTAFPIHQLGFRVPDVRRAVAVAVAEGGRLENSPMERDGEMHAAVRDPDGNTIELYGPPA